MGKYIDAEKLREKIYAEDTISLAHGSLPEFDQGCHYAFLTILSFIDSLQQEQPKVDLEKEFADFLEKENAYVDDNNKISYYNGSSFDHTCDIYPIARHFYELGLNARKEENK